MWRRLTYFIVASYSNRTPQTSKNYAVGRRMCIFMGIFNTCLCAEMYASILSNAVIYSKTLISTVAEKIKRIR
jgi:hypothetical protein